LNYEDARQFSRNKFNTTFEAVWEHSVPSSHALVFYYTSFEVAKQGRKSGIASWSEYNGVPVSLRHPHDSTDAEFEVFGVKSDKATTGANVETFPHEFVFVLSLPQRFLSALPGYECDEGLCMVPSQVLNALRPTSFSDVMDGKPWVEKLVLLPPHNILRSFLILDKDSLSRVSSSSSSSSFTENRNTTIKRNDLNYDIDVATVCLSTGIMPITSVGVYTDRMNLIREQASKLGLVPLYHYTSESVAPLILNGGLRMSTQGQGDGGVYVSTQGPASYDLGTDNYEVNIIKDCFGVERLDEYRGKGYLDVILIYGCYADVLEQVRHQTLLLLLCYTLEY
jgi:hypothetical protein